MNAREVHTQGGNFIAGDNIVHGDEVHGSKIENLHLHISALFPMYYDLVLRARSRLLQIGEPEPLYSHPPLFCYQWIRPDPCWGLSPKEIEIRIALRSRTSCPIQVLEIGLAEGNRALVSSPVSLPLEIEPFGTAEVLRYIVSANIFSQLGEQLSRPQIVYQIGDQAPSSELLLVKHPKDCAEIFVPIIDQKRLLQKIERCLVAAETDAAFHCLAIADSWGKGRSRALTECVRMARRTGFDVLSGTASFVTGRSSLHDPIRGALCTEIGLPAASREESVLHILHWLQQRDEQGYLDDCSIALLAQYLLDGSDRPPNLAAVVGCIFQWAHSRPLLLAIDNLHDALPSTGEVIHEIAGRLSGIPGSRQAQLAVCVTYNPDECDIGLRSCLREGVIELEDFSTSDVVEFAKCWFPELECFPGSQDSLVQFLSNRPILIRQSLNYLSYSGLISLDQGRWLLSSDFGREPMVRLKKSPEEPEGLGILLAEYRDLWDSDRQWIAKALRLAVAIGLDFEYELWLQAMHDPKVGLQLHVYEARDELIKREFIVPVDDGKGQPGMYRVYPPILWRLIWQQIQKDRNLAKDLHSVIARLLSEDRDSVTELSERIALQLLWSREKSYMPEAFERFCRLARSSVESCQLNRVVNLYQRAIEAAELSEDSIPKHEIYQVRYELAEAMDASGRWSEARLQATELAEECEKGEAFSIAASARILAGWMFHKLTKMVDAERNYDLAFTLVQAQPMPEIEARLLRKQAAWYAEQGLHSDASRCYDRALQLQQSAEDLAQTQGSYAEFLRRQCRLHEANNHIDSALKQCQTLAGSLAATLTKVRVNIQAGVLSRDLGDLDKSLDHLKQARDLALSVGALDEWAGAESWLGTVCSELEKNNPSKRVLAHFACAAELYELLGDAQSLAKLIREYNPLLLLAREYRAILLVCDRLRWLGISDPEAEKWRRVALKHLEQQSHHT